MTPAGAGKRRLVVALVAGIALLGALVALQLVDEGGTRTADDAPLRVKGIAVSRASLSGTIAGADGWRVTVTVAVSGDAQTVVASEQGRYQVSGLVAGLAEVTWEGRSADPGAANDGVDVAGTRVGRTHVVLSPGSNTLDLAL